MNDLFHPEHPMIRFLSRLFDLILLNNKIPATVMIAVFPLGILYAASAFDASLAAVCSLSFTIGFSGIIYITSYVLFRIFKKYENK